MNFAAEAYLFFPGGFGTLDEFFGILTLIQTEKIPRIPIILFGNDFWNPIIKILKDDLLEKHHTINNKEFDLFKITNSEDLVIKILKEAPISKWWEMVD